KGVSARDMSLSLGQANNYINTIENGKSLPSMQSFFNICEFFDISPQEFFDEGSHHPFRLRALVEEANRLDDHTLECFLEIMKKANAAGGRKR
ncbi:MAG TPA: helix-turn-helix domain-containing protein, partial [Candidatus Eisenbergiella merdavium]|nr:helix-turn-helix domain-containing protein [Candidatus Eisenbergiella merdavium]